jgi:hypothetical protein
LLEEPIYHLENYLRRNRAASAVCDYTCSKILLFAWRQHNTLDASALLFVLFRTGCAGHAESGNQQYRPSFRRRATGHPPAQHLA